MTPPAYLQDDAPKHISARDGAKAIFNKCNETTRYRLIVRYLVRPVTT